MQSPLRRLWMWLGQRSPMAFLVGGIGLLFAFALLAVDTVASVNVPELVISLFVLPSLLALLLVGLPGLYPFIADGSPRLAFGGAVFATIGGVSIGVTAVGKLALDLMGIIGWTEEGPLVAGFFIAMIAFFLSVVFYGVASVISREPSRVVGLLLLVIIVEPGVVLLNDVFGIDLGIVVAFLSLGIAGMTFIAIGYLLRTDSTLNRQVESSSDSVA